MVMIQGRTMVSEGYVPDNVTLDLVLLIRNHVFSPTDISIFSIIRLGIDAIREVAPSLRFPFRKRGGGAASAISFTLLLDGCECLELCDLFFEFGDFLVFVVFGR